MPPHRQSERALDLVEVLQQLPDAVIVAGEAMRIEFANDTAGKLLGCTAEELLDTPVEELVPPWTRQSHLEGVRRYLATGQPHLIGARPVRLSALGRDGREVAVELTLGAVGRPGEEGFRVIASLRDVSEEIETERQAAAARYLRAMVDVITELRDAGSVEDAYGRILPALCGSLDWDSASLWLHDEAEGVLHCVHAWVDESFAARAGSVQSIAEASRGMRMPLEIGLPGASWTRRQPIKVRSGEVPDEWPRSLIFRQHAHLQLVAMPLLRRDGAPLGVVELHSVRASSRDDDLLGVLAAIGRQVGEFIAGLQGEERRREAEREREELLGRMRLAERTQSFLLQASRLLGMAGSFAESLDALAALAVPTLGDVCLIDVHDESGTITRMAARHADASRQAELEQLASRYPPHPAGGHPSVAVMRSGESMWSDTMSDEFLRARTRDEEHYRLVKALGFSSYLCVPLKSRRRVLGTITIVSTGSDRRIGNTELVLAESLASQAAEIVEKARLYEREHEMAHVLQSSLLPPALEHFPGYEIAVRYLPSTLGAEVGGDWYDVVALADGTKAVTVGDVSGHDMRAAAAMGQLRSAARALSPEAGSPGALIDGMRGGWDRLGLERTATVAVAALHDGGRAVLASAGHPPPMVLGGDHCELVPLVPSTPLGAPRTPSREVEILMPEGTTLLLYTDGLIEVRRRALAEGLEDLAMRLSGFSGGLEELCDVALARLSEERSDDVALLAARRVG